MRNLLLENSETCIALRFFSCSHCMGLKNTIFVFYVTQKPSHAVPAEPTNWFDFFKLLDCTRHDMLTRRKLYVFGTNGLGSKRPIELLVNRHFGVRGLRTPSGERQILCGILRSCLNEWIRRI